MPRHPDIAAVAAIVAEVAAEVVLPHFGRLAAGEVHEKTGPQDLVTVADLEAERLLTQRLAALVPGSVVVGEEAVSADPAVLDRLGGEAPVWVIDPIDGTLNFANRVPLFGIMVAYVVGGETQAAWIHDPLHGRMATAARGEGAWLDGRRLRLDQPDALSAMHGTIHGRSGDRDLAARMARRSDRVASVLVLRCAAQEYLSMLTGGLHFAIYNRVLPWDHAAGNLLHTEAGGIGKRLDGRRYRPGDGHQGAPLLVAPCEAGWHQIYDGLIAEG